MSLSQPTPPNPTQTADTQQGFNQQAATQQAELNDVNQQTPFGSETFTQSGTNPDGTPKFTATTALSPQEQGLFNATVGTQQQVANDAGQLATNLAPSLTSGPNLSNDALTSQLLNMQTQFMQPTFTQQQSNLDSQLAAQGITQGSTAYDNAERSLNQNQTGSVENAMAQDQNQVFNQALQSYEAPIQTLGTLLGEGQPGSVSSSLVSTPQEQVQPANFESTAEQNFDQQNQQFQNTISGLFSIPSAILGGLARAPGTPAAGTTSDRRAKRDIAEIGRLFDGKPVYRFRYHDDPKMQIGLMAQDVAEDCPEAVHVGDDGFMRVNYERATESAVRGVDG
ncbi:MAG: tail fiber domain-containing protein [Methylocella sp.]